MKYQNHDFLSDAVTLLVGGSITILDEGNVNFNSGQVEPTQDEVTTKIAELEISIPLRLLKERRYSLLLETDWWAGSDLTMTADQIAYRKALRDLPSTASPKVDSEGRLTGVIWPTKPE